jgi:hypothetical protein
MFGGLHGLRNVVAMLRTIIQMLERLTYRVIKQGEAMSQALDNLKAAVDDISAKVDSAVADLDALETFIKNLPPASEITEADVQAIAERVTSIGANLQAAVDRDQPPA